MRKRRKLGRGVEEIPDEMLLKKYYVSRAIVCDTAGRVYGSHGEGRMFRYDPGSGALELLEHDFPIVTGTEYGLISETSVESLMRTGDGVIYGGTCQDGYLFRLDAENGEITNLGKPVMQGRIRALCVWKGDLYGIAGEDLGIAHLFSYNLAKGGFTELGVLQGGGKTGFAVNICDSMAAGPQGRLYIGQSERISALLSIRDIRYEPYQSP